MTGRAHESRRDALDCGSRGDRDEIGSGRTEADDHDPRFHGFWLLEDALDDESLL